MMMMIMSEFESRKQSLLLFQLHITSEFTSQEDFRLGHANCCIESKLVLDDDVSVGVVRWRETHWSGCGIRQPLTVLNVMILFEDWSCDLRIIISQTSHEVTHTRFGYISNQQVRSMSRLTVNVNSRQHAVSVSQCNLIITADHSSKGL